MAEAAFGVTYDGPALADGRMPVRDLAPALLALGEIFAEASALSYPDKEPVALNFQATAEGSFEVHLILEATGVWNQVVDLLNTDGADALSNLMQIVGGGYGLFAFIRAITRRLIKKQEEVSPGRIRVTLEDGATLEVAAEVLALYRNSNARSQARQVVEPLKRAGVDELKLEAAEGDVQVNVSAAEVREFEPVEEAEVPLLEREGPMILAIASVAFIEGNKWRFSDGDRTFYATLEDEGFLRRVEAGAEAFRNGDFLKCQMRIVQYRQGDALHTDYYVKRVIEHIPREVQMPFDLTNDPPEQ